MLTCIMLKTYITHEFANIYIKQTIDIFKKNYINITTLNANIIRKNNINCQIC